MKGFAIPRSDIGPVVLYGDGELALLLRPEQTEALFLSLASPGDRNAFTLTQDQAATLGWQWRVDGESASMVYGGTTENVWRRRRQPQ